MKYGTIVFVCRSRPTKESDSIGIVGHAYNNYARTQTPSRAPFANSTRRARRPAVANPERSAPRRGDAAAAAAAGGRRRYAAAFSPWEGRAGDTAAAAVAAPTAVAGATAATCSPSSASLVERRLYSFSRQTRRHLEVLTHDVELRSTIWLLVSWLAIFFKTVQTSLFQTHVRPGKKIQEIVNFGFSAAGPPSSGARNELNAQPPRHRITNGDETVLARASCSSAAWHRFLLERMLPSIIVHPS